MKNIVLVGFMGTGKSVVGKWLAKRLGWSFLDLDEMIEGKAGKTVAQIFKEEGEAGFRKRESEAVRSLNQRKETVLATGGGVMLDESNVKVLKSLGKLVCLTCRPEVILQRTISSLPLRPLLSGADSRQRIEELLALRAPFYAKADLTLDTSDRSIEEVAEEILRAVELQGQEP